MQENAPCKHRALILGIVITLSSFTFSARAKQRVPAFPLKTKGRWIIDQDGLRVKLACVNWGGADEKDGVVGGLHWRTTAGIASTFKDMGFNCVRLPWSVWMVETNPAIAPERTIDLLEANPQLMGLTALDILDAVIESCAAMKLMVILDNHVSDGDWCCGDTDENGLWYNARWPENRWLSAHKTLAARYARQPWVIGSELRNEVRGNVIEGVYPTWGDRSRHDWHLAATKAGDAIHFVNPALLIMIGGLGYGKDLRGVYKLPIRLQIPNKVVYTAHCYTWSYPSLPNEYQALKDQLGKDWGFIVEPDKPYTAPLFVSEFGTFADCHKDSCATWWPDFLQYLSEGDFDWAVWHGDGTWSRDSLHRFNGPTNYGVLASDWRSPAADGELLVALKSVMPATLGPGAEFQELRYQCADQCADTWISGWSNGRKDTAACSPCLRNRPCRGYRSVEEWCNDGWAKVSCSWTCCRANLLNASTCVESKCQRMFLDMYDPGWPSGKRDTSACLQCLQDDTCRGHQSRAEWCASTWAAEHCQLTCCTAGFGALYSNKVNQKPLVLL